MVKSGNNPFPHDDFGVWGIATEPLNEPYILWSENALAQVSRVGTTDTFAPLADAYWLTGYEYHFLALAPFASGVTGLNISKSYTVNNQLKEYPTMSFTYDMTSTYESKVYNYDLLGAAQYRKINTPSDKTEQDLMFWHLFSQIYITVEFTGNHGTGAELKNIYLENVSTKGEYTVSYAGNENHFNCQCGINNQQKTPLTFSQFSTVIDEQTNATKQAVTLNILPQDISGLKLFLDFTTNGAAIDEFEIDLTNAKAKSPYLYNNKYNWKITLSPKLEVSFKVEVAQWTSSPIKDANNDNEFEII